MAHFPRLIQGNEACAEGAIKAGLRFFAGYPITPSTEIAEILARRLPEEGGVFLQMEDEIASMGAVIGASLAGAKAMTATSGPGFSLKQENIGYASMAEVPCVIVNVQRVGPSTGMPTRPSQADFMQSRWGTHGDHPVVVYCPWSVQEVYSLTIQAFSTSEELRVPVVLMMDEVIAHLRERFEQPNAPTKAIERRLPMSSDGKRPGSYEVYHGDVPLVPNIGDGCSVHVTGLFHDAYGIPTNDTIAATRMLERLCGKIESRRKQLCLTEAIGMNDARSAIFAYGAVARSALAAVAELRKCGHRVGLIRGITLWPFPDETLFEAGGSMDFILVPEMNMGQASREVQRAVAGRCKVVPLGSAVGELIAPSEIVDAFKREVGAVG